VAYLGVGGISIALIFVVGFGLARLERLGDKPRRGSAAPSGARSPERKTGTRPATA
jgi:hypothetical protein